MYLGEKIRKFDLPSPDCYLETFAHVTRETITKWSWVVLQILEVKKALESPASKENNPSKRPPASAEWPDTYL